MYKCVESELAMTQVSKNYQADYINAVGTGVIGGTLWGAGQYLFNKKPFVDKNGNIKDSFVKNMEDALVAIKDKATLENVEFQKSLEKEIDVLKDHSELKDFINKKKNDFMRITEDEVKLLNEEVTKMDINEGKNFVKRIFKSDGKYQKYYKETLNSCYEGSKLEHAASKLPKEKFEALKKVIQKARRDSALKSAGIFIGVCSACCCFFEWWNSRKK